MDIAFVCGHDQGQRDQQRKLAKRLLASRTSRGLPLPIQRSVWFTSAVRSGRKNEEAVALAIHLDKNGSPIPAASELGIEIRKPPHKGMRAALNVLLVVGEPGPPSLALVDAMSRYLFLVSGCPTKVVLEKSLAEATHRAFGWRFTSNPIPELDEFAALVADGNPLTSVCARAIAFAREATDADHLYIDGLQIDEANPAILLVNDDSKQLTFRAWEAWSARNENAERIVEEVVAPILTPRLKETAEGPSWGGRA